MATLDFDKLKSSPGFHAMAEQALARDRAEADAKREAAWSEYQAAGREFLDQQGPLLGQLGQVSAAVRAAEAALGDARRRHKAVAKHLRDIGMERDRRKMIASRVLIHTIPNELATFIDDAVDLDGAVRSVPITTRKEPTKVISKSSGRRQTVTRSNTPELASWLAAIKAAREAAQLLTQQYTPADELAEQLKQLRASIPDDAWRLLKPWRASNIFTPKR